jgi:hypothetical protein
MDDDVVETRIIKAQLEDGAIIDVQTSGGGGEEDIALTLYPFKGVTDKIESIAQSLLATFKKVKPHSASVEFGLEVGVESGQLTALLVKGTGTAHLTVTLQWSQSHVEENNTPINEEG